ncbi:ankyrin repeat and protein kinase domain-containing protein [Achlya hypogyna]|uniref:Ankyrin repeat and protein kinase domain-containing protein n=1 Tax=Achlya hypogyna TaxID=1202772 RepID=A0A1V9Y493_ACHHY|nr:ankyrin repeat and protein kinase domain-containing protein [Achlya hypogyna]
MHHEGFVHRDPKSENGLLSTTHNIKVGYLGITKECATNMTAGVGTLSWMAPKVLICNSKLAYAFTAHTYSFGVIQTELDTLQKPYADMSLALLTIMNRVQAGTLRPSLSADCSARLRDIATACMAHILAERPSTNDVVQLLQRQRNLERAPPVADMLPVHDGFVDACPLAPLVSNTIECSGCKTPQLVTDVECRMCKKVVPASDKLQELISRIEASLAQVNTVQTCSVCDEGASLEVASYLGILVLGLGDGPWDVLAVTLAPWTLSLQRAVQNALESVRAMARKNLGQELFSAAGDGKESEVARLLLKGAPLEWTDRYEQTPLCIAAILGHEGVVRQLIAAGANVHHEDKLQFTPFHFAAYKGHVESAHHLIAAGADVNAVTENKYTPLHYASADGKDALVRLLLEAGADTSLTNKKGKIARDLAKKRNKTSVLRAFDEALLQAATSGDTSRVRDLLATGVDVDASNDSGETPLLVAVTRGHAAIVELLLEAGAEAFQTTRDGSLLLVAQRHGHDAVVAVLEKALKTLLFSAMSKVDAAKTHLFFVQFAECG